MFSRTLIKDVEWIPDNSIEASSQTHGGSSTKTYHVPRPLLIVLPCLGRFLSANSGSTGLCCYQPLCLSWEWKNSVVKFIGSELLTIQFHLFPSTTLQLHCRKIRHTKGNPRSLTWQNDDWSYDMPTWACHIKIKTNLGYKDEIIPQKAKSNTTQNKNNIKKKLPLTLTLPTHKHLTYKYLNIQLLR